jgi:D-hexose-6-phosphate mutarotase
MIGDAKWPYQFALTYSVTLSPKDLETTLVVRNTGTSNYDFQTLFHTYLKVDVSSCIIQKPFTASSLYRLGIISLDYRCTALQCRNYFA